MVFTDEPLTKMPKRKDQVPELQRCLYYHFEKQIIQSLEISGATKLSEKWRCLR